MELLVGFIIFDVILFLAIGAARSYARERRRADYFERRAMRGRRFHPYAGFGHRGHLPRQRTFYHRLYGNRSADPNQIFRHGPPPRF